MVKATKTDKSATQARRALVFSSAFYVLIAFEFLYMASPFAAYFYAVYGPGLDWLQSLGTTGWLIQFFLPHVVEETTSFPVDIHDHLGFALMIAGLAGFAIGAIQVYVAKLRGRGAVMGGLYRHIRHPQYLALIVASIGMMLIWSRYLVVAATVTVIFIYIALARAEEGICLRRFPTPAPNRLPVRALPVRECERSSRPRAHSEGQCTTLAAKRLQRDLRRQLSRRPVSLAHPAFLRHVAESTLVARPIFRGRQDSWAYADMVFAHWGPSSRLQGQHHSQLRYPEPFSLIEHRCHTTLKRRDQYKTASGEAARFDSECRDSY